jgi:hypothetical protein
MWERVRAFDDFLKARGRKKYILIFSSFSTACFYHFYAAFYYDMKSSIFVCLNKERKKILQKREKE